MNISIETTGTLGRRLTISVPSESFEERITERLGEAARQVRLPGFRPGKVPMKEVRRRFGPSVRAEVASEMMQSSFVDAVGQESLSPAGAPSLEVVKMDPGIDFEFTATFEVFPNVSVADLSGVSVRRPEANIERADIDAMINRLREQRASFEPVERPAAEGDQVEVDFAGSRDGEAFAGGQGEDVSFEVGGGQMIADFDAAVRGMSAGEQKTFDATFPEDYHAADLAGATVSFDLTLKGVKARETPVLDEDFYAEYGVEEATEEAFEAEVQANMAREMDSAQRNAVKSQVLDELQRLHSDMQVPEALIAQEIDALQQRMMQQLNMVGPQGQTIPGLDGELFRGEAEKRVTVGLVMNALVEEAGIEADAETVRARIEELAQPYAQPEQVVNYYYSNEDQLRQIEMAVIEDQVIDHILESATIEPVAADYEAVVSGTALAPAAEEEAQAADSADDTAAVTAD
ncbi:MAG: trigger factor [Pseudomonadota bacterium]